jgi:tRNA 2-thiouridine synthesizing protein A
VARELPLSLLSEGCWKLDCLGMLCPVPVVKTGQAIRRVALGDLLTVVADDPGVELDLKDWCTANRQEWIDVQSTTNTWTTRIRRAR